MAIKIDIKSKGKGMESAYVYAPFDKGKMELAKKGYEIPSLEESAQLRIQKCNQLGNLEDIKIDGHWIREAWIYQPCITYLTKNSPIMANANTVTNCHRKRGECGLSKDLLEEALTNKVSVGNREIPTKRFGDEEITVFAFGKYAKDYGDLLYRAGIYKINFWHSNPSSSLFSLVSASGPIVRPVWLRGIGNFNELSSNSHYDYSSDICCSHGSLRGGDTEGWLHKNSKVRGIKFKEY